MFGFLQSLIGNNSAKEVKKMRKIVDHINELEPNYVKLSDANLVAKTVACIEVILQKCVLVKVRP